MKKLAVLFVCLMAAVAMAVPSPVQLGGPGIEAPWKTGPEMSVGAGTPWGVFFDGTSASSSVAREIASAVMFISQREITIR
jgi:hypothetical protein